MLMGLVVFGLLPALQARGYNIDFAVLIGAAFGIGYSLDNGRAPSRYSRILGAIFLFLYGWVLISDVLAMLAGGF